MTDGTFRGVAHGGMVVLETQTPQAEGTEVVVTPVVGACGSPAAVLAAVEDSPRVPAECVDGLEQLIAQGRRGAARLDLFMDDRPTHSEDGVDLTLIRWMLSLTPLERLQVLQQHLNALAKIRDANPDL